MSKEQNAVQNGVQSLACYLITLPICHVSVCQSVVQPSCLGFFHVEDLCICIRFSDESCCISKMDIFKCHFVHGASLFQSPFLSHWVDAIACANAAPWNRGKIFGFKSRQLLFIAASFQPINTTEGWLERSLLRWPGRVVLLMAVSIMCLCCIMCFAGRWSCAAGSFL